MSCEGRRLPSAGAGVITTALHLLGLRLPLEVERLFTERSSASEKLVFKIQVIRRPRVQMDGFLCLFVFSLSLTAEYMMLAIKRHAALYTRVAFRDQGAMSSSLLFRTHHSAEGWHLLSHSHTLWQLSLQTIKCWTQVKYWRAAFVHVSSVSMWQQQREMLASVLLNLFLTGAEFIHPQASFLCSTTDLLICWFILYGFRIAPSIHSIYTQG